MALLGLGAVLTVGALGAAAPAASAAGLPALGARAGLCTTADQDAVSVVIDHGALGGGVQTYCATGLSARSTGIDALRAVWISTTGTVHDGPGFICRIQGRPSASEVVPLPNDPSYTEQCVDTPPATAYWSYWHAPSGGPWTYSQLGVMSHRVILGGFEGWSFATGSASGAASPPRVSPVTEPAPEPPPAPAPEPDPNPPAAQPNANNPQTGQTGQTGATDPADPAASQSEQPAPSDDPSDLIVPVSASFSPNPSAPASALIDPPEPAAGSGPSPTALIGLGAIVLLGGAGLTATWLRRRQASRVGGAPPEPADLSDRPADSAPAPASPVDATAATETTDPTGAVS